MFLPNTSDLNSARSLLFYRWNYYRGTRVPQGHLCPFKTPPPCVAHVALEPWPVLAQASLELLAVLSLLSNLWDHRHEPPHLAKTYLSFFFLRVALGGLELVEIFLPLPPQH